jgi:type II secretory pathway pseudopilin PulG
MSDAPMTPPFAPAPAPKTSRLAIAAIVCAVLGACCLPLSLAGAVLGIVALVKGKGPRDSTLGKVLSIVSIAILPFTLGIAAAIAVPAFVTYVRRAKAAEATANVQVLATGVQAAYAQSRALPESLPPLPAGAPSDQKRDWPAGGAAAGYAALGFNPAPVYFTYVYERGADGQSFVVRAVGDLDADGVQSIFSLEGRVEGDSVVVSSVQAENETE